MLNFEDLMYLFSSSVENRGIVRLNLLEAALLYKIAKKTENDIVEIGRKYGGSALLLASAISNERKVYSIDIEEHERVKKYFSISPKEITDKIIMLEGKSEKIGRKWDMNKKVGMVFVDGDHSYKGVKKDIEIWMPILLSGGYACFHDVRGTALGLEPLISDLKKSGWIETDCAETLVVMRKP